MKYIAIIGPARSFDHFISDFVGGKKKTHDIYIVDGICFFWVANGDRLRGRVISAFVTIGPVEEWTSGHREAVHIAQDLLNRKHNKS